MRTTSLPVGGNIAEFIANSDVGGGVLDTTRVPLATAQDSLGITSQGDEIADLTGRVGTLETLTSGGVVQLSGDQSVAGVKTFASPPNVPDPTTAQNPVNLEYFNANGPAQFNFTAAVACATTANIALSGEQTVDGVTTSASRVWVKNQTAAANNGIYVSSSSAWARASDANTNTLLGRIAATVLGGSLNAGLAFGLSLPSSAITVGTTALNPVVLPTGGAVAVEAGTRAAADAALSTAIAAEATRAEAAEDALGPPVLLALADVYALSHVRYAERYSAGAYNPKTIFDPSVYVLAGGATYAGNRFTLPPGASITSPTLPIGSGTYYAGVVATEIPSPADVVGIKYDSTSLLVTNNLGEYSASNAIPASGSHTFKFTNTSGSATIVFFPPSIATSPAYEPELPNDKLISPVPSIPVFDEDWRALPAPDRFAHVLAEKQSTKVVDSVSGNNSNAGTLYAAKQTVPTLAQGDVVGLVNGSVFHQEMPTNDGTTNRGIVIQNVSYGTMEPLPIVTGANPVPDGSWTLVSGSIYSFSYTSDNNLQSFNPYPYDETIVWEINTTLQNAAPSLPLAARSMLTQVTGTPTGPGQVWAHNTSGNNWTLQIWPTDGNAPGTLYTYEATYRHDAINWGNSYARDGAVRGVQTIAGAHGYGGLAGPYNSDVDLWIGVGSGTHCAVIQGGRLRRSLVYSPGGSISNSIGAVFYSPLATPGQWLVEDTYFYAQKCSAFACHTSGAGNWAYGFMRRCAFINSRAPDGGLYGQALGANNITQAFFTNVYVDGYQNGAAWGLTGTIYASVTKSIFRRCGLVQAGGVFSDNIVQVENQSQPGSVNNRNSTMSAGTSASLSAISNNLFYAKNVANALADYNTTVLAGWVGVVNVPQGAVNKNIFIINITGVCTIANFIGQGTGPFTYTADYNLYIIVGAAAGQVLCRRDTAAGGNLIEAPGPALGALYQAFSGQDTHSMFMDIRTNPLGMKAIFVDADNGDFRWAQTPQAAQAQAYCKLNGVGPSRVISRWPDMPTVDEWANTIALAA